jgi:hypothetical protein
MQGDLSPRRLAELTTALEEAELQQILLSVPIFATLQDQEVAIVARCARARAPFPSPLTPHSPPPLHLPGRACMNRPTCAPCLHDAALTAP